MYFAQSESIFILYAVRMWYWNGEKATADGFSNLQKKQNMILTVLHIMVATT